MGIFDIFRRKRPIDPALVQAVEEYKQRMAKAPAEAYETIFPILGGLNEQDVSMLVAADVGLIDVPSRLAARLELYRNLQLKQERIERETGIQVDDLIDAIRLLTRQPWWPDFVAKVREQKGIQTAKDIGRWSWHGKKIAPYVWECGFVYQTPEAFKNDGPVSVWSWRVDLQKHITEPIRKGQVPWDEIGTEGGKQLIQSADSISQVLKKSLQDNLNEPGMPDFERGRWRYEFCIWQMFWVWYFANLSSFRKAGITEQWLDAYHKSALISMAKAGLISTEKVEEVRAWEKDCEERFMAYKQAFENRPELPVLFTGTVGWVFARFLFPGEEPNCHLVMFMNEDGHLRFLHLDKMVKSLEDTYSKDKIDEA